MPLVETFKTVKQTIFQMQFSTLIVKLRKYDGYDLGYRTLDPPPPPPPTVLQNILYFQKSVKYPYIHMLFSKLDYFNNF